MASQLTAALGRIVDALTAAGVRATMDARDVSAPCAWVTVHDVTAGTLCGELGIRADVYLIAGDRGGRIAMDELGALLDKAADVLTFDEPARAVAATPPGLPGPMPALVITTTTE